MASYSEEISFQNGIWAAILVGVLAMLVFFAGCGVQIAIDRAEVRLCLKNQGVECYQATFGIKGEK